MVGGKKFGLPAVFGGQKGSSTPKLNWKRKRASPSPGNSSTRRRSPRKKNAKKGPMTSSTPLPTKARPKQQQQQKKKTKTTTTTRRKLSRGKRRSSEASASRTKPKPAGPGATPVRPKVLVRPYESHGFLAPPVTVDDSVLQDEVDLSEIPLPPTPEAGQGDVTLVQLKKKGQGPGPSRKRKAPDDGGPPPRTPKRQSPRNRKSDKGRESPSVSTRAAKRPKLDMTLEEGELASTDDDDNDEVRPLFVLDRTGDPDAALGMVLPPPPASPDVVVVGEVQRTPGLKRLHSFIGRAPTPKRSDRYASKKKKKGGTRVAKALNKTKAKLDKGRKGGKWVDLLKRGKAEHRTNAQDFGPRKSTPSPVAGRRRNDLKRSTVVQNPFYSSGGGPERPRMPPPPSPAAILGAQQQQQHHHHPLVPSPSTHRLAAPYQFRPDRPPNTDFTSGVGRVEGGVFEFSGRQKRLVPSMGVRQASRGALGAGAGAGAAQARDKAGAGLENVHLSSPSLSAAGSQRPRPGELRPIVIDGSNVAMAHGDSLQRRGCFSSRGIDLVVDYFLRRGHREVFAVVPQSRREVGMAQDVHILERLHKRGNLVFTPSRRLQTQSYTMYDDRYIVQYSALKGAIMVSNDNYRDLMSEGPEMREAIERRLLMFTFMPGDTLMFPQDPLGKGGPTLDEFLSY